VGGKREGIWKGKIGGEGIERSQVFKKSRRKNLDVMNMTEEGLNRVVKL